MRVETVALAAVLLLVLFALRPRRSRRRHHSFLYRHYIDNNSRLWRTRRFVWYWTSNRRCEGCGRRVALHRKGLRYRMGAPVVTVHHKNYRRLGHEHRSDVSLLCWSCHSRRDAGKHR